MRKPSRFEEMRRRAAATSPRVDSQVAVEEFESCDTMELSADDSVLLHPHRLEQDVRHQLMSEPGLNFTSLVVRRMRDGLCLEGVLEADDNADNVSSIVRRICGATQVLNHLVVHRTHEVPRKG